MCWACVPLGILSVNCLVNSKFPCNVLGQDILSKLCISQQCSLDVLTRKTGICPQCMFVGLAPFLDAHPPAPSPAQEDGPQEVSSIPQTVLTELPVISECSQPAPQVAELSWMALECENSGLTISPIICRFKAPASPQPEVMFRGTTPGVSHGS